MHSSSRITAVFASLLLVVSLALLAPIAGCGSEDSFDPTASYTPKGIADELVFRLQVVEQSKAQPSISDAPLGDALGALTKGGRSGGDATKKAPGDWSESELVSDAASKIRSLSAIPRDQALKQVLEAIQSHDTLSDDTKARITKDLEAQVGQGV